MLWHNNVILLYRKINGNYSFLIKFKTKKIVLITYFCKNNGDSLVFAFSNSISSGKYIDVA